MILQPSDALIAAIKRYQAGDQAAFDTIYFESIRYVTKSVLNVLNRVAPDATEDLQQDIIQDTYMTIIAKLDTLNDPYAFLQWAGRIATRHAEHSWRKDIRLHQIEQSEDAALYEIADEDFIPEDILFNKERQAQIRKILDTLPINQYLCVVEYYYNGLKEVEVALKLGMPVNTVKTNLSRARKKLHAAIETEEKRSGVKLYSMSWMLLTIFSEDVMNMLGDVEQDIRILESLHEKIAAGATVLAAGAAAEGTSAMGGSLLGKIIAGILAGVVTVGGVAGGIYQIEQMSIEPTYVSEASPTEPILPCTVTYTLVDARTDDFIHGHTCKVTPISADTSSTYACEGTTTLELTSQYDYLIEISAQGYYAGSFLYRPQENGLNCEWTLKMTPLAADISGEEITYIEQIAQTLPQLDQWENYLLGDDAVVSSKLWQALVNAINQGELIRCQETTRNGDTCYAVNTEDAILFLLNAYGAAPKDIKYGTYDVIFENDGTTMYVAKQEQVTQSIATLTYIGRTTYRKAAAPRESYDSYTIRFYRDRYVNGNLQEDARKYFSAEICKAPDSEYGWMILSYSEDVQGALREVLPRSADGGMDIAQAYRDIDHMLPAEAAVYAERFLGLAEGNYYGVGMDTDAECGIRLVGEYNMGDTSVYKFLFWSKDQYQGTFISGKIIEIDQYDGTRYDEMFLPGDVYIDFKYTPVDEKTGQIIGSHTLIVTSMISDWAQTYTLSGSSVISLVAGKDYALTVCAEGYPDTTVHVNIDENCTDPSLKIIMTN